METHTILPPRVILAATDFSDGSKLALTAAAELARGVAADFHVVHAEEPLLDAAAQHSGFDLAAQTEESLRTFVGLAIPTDSPLPHLHVATGPAIDVILDAARRTHADLIVMGSHGRTGIGRALFGSIAEGVLRRADRPVLIVPARHL